MPQPEITVRGAGIFGLSSAWALARRGARVRVLDPFGVGAGASGGLVGALAPHVPETWNDKKAFQLESLLMAGDWWAEVAEAGGVDPGYARTGRLQPLADAAAVAMARARAEGARGLWQGRATWSVVGAEALPPGWRPESATGLYVHDTLTARIHPRRALAALVAALRACDVPVLTGPAAAAADSATGPTLWATGVAGLRDLRVARPSVKGQAVLLGHAAADRPQLFVAGLHIVPHADGTVAVGSTSEPGVETTTTDAQADALVARARAVLPDLAAAPVLDRWAGLRPRAPSRAPMLGPWPGRPGHFIANGGFKIGFGVAPRVAETMADILLDGTAAAIPDGWGVPGPG